MKRLLVTLSAGICLLAQPTPRTFQLPNGLRVVHLEDHERPLVRMWLHLRLSPADVPTGREGLLPLALRMLDRAEAGDLRPLEVQGLLEASGIRMTRHLDGQGLLWKVLARSREQDRALGLLADRLSRAVLDPQALEAERKACWEGRDLPAGPEDPLLTGTLGPWGAFAPTLAGLGAATLEDLLALQSRVFRPERAVLVLHGDLGLEQAKRLVFLSLGAWAPAGSGVEAIPPSADPRPPALVPVPKAPLDLQVALPLPSTLTPQLQALISDLVEGDPDLVPVRVRTCAWGLLASLPAGETSPQAARALLEGRLEAVRQRGFTQADLHRAQAAWRARQALLALHPEAQMARALAGLLGRGVQEDRLAALSLEELNRGLRRWLDPTGCRWALRGDPDLLKEALQPAVTP